MRKFSWATLSPMISPDRKDEILFCGEIKSKDADVMMITPTKNQVIGIGNAIFSISIANRVTTTMHRDSSRSGLCTRKPNTME